MALTTTEEALVRQLLEQQAAILSLAESESTIISKLGATKVTIADLTAASSIDDADLFLLRQGTTEKSVSGAVVKALVPTVVDATETDKGIVELATAAETQTGTDNSRAVHPAGLASLTATESRAGLIAIATNAEAQAFTANKAIDGAKLSAAFKGSNQLISQNGYQKLPGGLIIQWSSFTTSAAGFTTYTFPIAFPTACLHVAQSTQGSYSLIGTPLCNLGSKTATTVPLAMSNNANGFLVVTQTVVSIGY